MAEIRSQLKKSIILLSLVASLLSLYVLLDFSFNQAQPEPYVFDVPELIDDQPVILKKQNMMVIVARYSEEMLATKQHKDRLSKISSSFRLEPQRVDKSGYFVTLGYGTLQGCPLLIDEFRFRESCSDAIYNHLGRSFNQGLYKNLEKVDYRFSRNHSVLTIY